MNAYHVVKTSVGSIPDYVLNPDMEMPEVQLNGLSCVGTIEIPALIFVLQVHVVMKI